MCSSDKNFEKTIWNEEIVESDYEDEGIIGRVSDWVYRRSRSWSSVQYT